MPATKHKTVAIKARKKEEETAQKIASAIVVIFLQLVEAMFIYNQKHEGVSIRFSEKEKKKKTFLIVLFSPPTKM